MRLRRELARRGEMSTSELVAILLIAVAAVVIIVIFFKVRSTIDDTQNGVCAIQVRDNAVQGKVFGREYPADIASCQTKYVTIQRRDLPADWEKADLEVKHRLAEEMRKCAGQWGNGEIDLFSKEDSYCAFCADVGFDAALQDEYRQRGGNIQGFTTYLHTTAIPGSTMTYAEYLGGVTRDQDGALPNTIPAVNIAMSKNYTILFSYQKIQTDGDLAQRWGMLFGKDVTPSQSAKISGIAVGTAAGIASGLGTAAGAGTLITSLVAAGPIGWTVLAAGALVVVGSATATGMKVGSVVAAITYFNARHAEQWTIISATYITPESANSIYVKSCGTMAAPPRSP